MSKEKIKRESGFYWIKHRGQWTIGQWYENAQSWSMAGASNGFIDKGLELIHEEKIEKPEDLDK